MPASTFPLRGVGVKVPAALYRVHHGVEDVDGDVVDPVHQARLEEEGVVHVQRVDPGHVERVGPLDAGRDDQRLEMEDGGLTL